MGQSSRICSITPLFFHIFIEKKCFFNDCEKVMCSKKIATHCVIVFSKVLQKSCVLIGWYNNVLWNFGNTLWLFHNVLLQYVMAHMAFHHNQGGHIALFKGEFELPAMLVGITMNTPICCILTMICKGCAGVYIALPSETQYVHFQLHTNYFLLPWKILQEINRWSVLFSN